LNFVQEALTTDRVRAFLFDSRQHSSGNASRNESNNRHKGNRCDQKRPNEQPLSIGGSGNRTMVVVSGSPLKTSPHRNL
jgi:hypothetical protein